MFRPKLVKNGTSGIGHISGIVMVAFLSFSWSGPASSAETTADPEEKPHLVLAPIYLSHSISGAISYSYIRNGINTSKSTQQGLNLSVSAYGRANTFIWQPWFSQVNGILSATVNDNHTTSSSAPMNHTLDTYINGDLGLNLVKDSRFPFEGHIYRRDNRYSSSLLDSSFATLLTGYSLTQAYTTRNQRIRTNVSLRGDKNSWSNIDPVYSDELDASVDMQLTRTQSVTIEGNAFKQDQPGTGINSLYKTLNAYHSYRPNNIFSVSSFGNLVKTNREQTITQQYDSNAAQLTSFASLRPEKSPLTMTGSVRLYNADFASNGFSTSSKNSNFNLGANYLFSPLIRMYGSVNVEDKNNDTQVIRTNGALTAIRNLHASTEIGGFRYSGSMGGSLGFRNESTSGPTQNTSSNSQALGIRLSHALDKSNRFAGGSLARNLNQILELTFPNTGPSFKTLGTGGFLSWTRSAGKQSSSIRLGADDSRNLGGLNRIYDMINLQATRSESISHNEELQGNLTVQTTNTRSELFPGSYSSRRTITPSASIRYFNLRTFKVLHLKFQSNLLIYDSNIASTQNLAEQNRATRQWDNNFDYQIGQTTMQLTTRIAQINNTPISKIFFSITRTF